MSDRHVKYLLIGGGVAGAAAAEAIREIDHDGTMVLVGQEINRPYNRPPLSKDYLTRKVNRPALFVNDAHWFARNSMELHTGLRASRLEPARHSVLFDNGEEIVFDKLLIA